VYTYFTVYAKLFDIAPNIVYTILFIVTVMIVYQLTSSDKTSVPYNRIGKHFDLIRPISNNTSSDALRPIFPNIPLKDFRLPLLSARPAVTPATLKRAATNFVAW